MVKTEKKREKFWDHFINIIYVQEEIGIRVKVI